MALTVRLSPTTERTLERLVRTRRQTRSDVVREAIEHYAASESKQPDGDSVYDAWVDVIGIGRLPASDATHTTGERFTELVRAKARARRAG